MGITLSKRAPKVRTGTERRSEWQVLFRLMQSVRPYWGKTALVTLLEIADVTVGAIPPWFAKFLIDEAFPNRNWGMVFFLFALILVTDLFNRLLDTTKLLLMRYIKFRVSLDLRVRLHRHLQSMSLTFLQNRPVGEHMYRNTSDVDGVTELVSEFLPSIVRNVFEFALILAFTAYFDPFVTLLVFMYMIPYTTLAYKTISIRRGLDWEARQRWAKRDAGLQEGIAGITTVKSFARRRFEVRRYARLNARAQRVAIRDYFASLFQDRIVQKLLPYLKKTALWLYFARKVIVGETTLGMIFPLLSFMDRLTNPLESLVRLSNWTRLVLIPAERLLQTFDVQPAVVETPNAVRMPAITGEVVIKNVSFQYEPKRPVLEDVSLTIAPGRKVAIVGASGAGKSTVAALLLRLHDPDTGCVIVDGHDLRDVRLTSYQQQIGLVLQETYLFGGTIADNLRLAKPDATREEMDRATRLAEIYDWIQAQPLGYDQDLAEGTSLSVGQKQRLGIARALISDPRLLILDEPTSALDSRTEEQIARTLREAARGRTTVVVSHRLHTITDADEILVMDGGRIVQRGTHQALVSVPGIYQDLWRLYECHPSDEDALACAAVGRSLEAPV